MQKEREDLLRLTRETIEELVGENEIPLSAVIEKCLRISSLREDKHNYVSFLIEMVDLQDNGQYERVRITWKRYFPDDEKGWTYFVRRYKDERKIASTKLALAEKDAWLRVTNIERKVKKLEERFKEIPPPRFSANANWVPFRDFMENYQRQDERQRLREEKEVWQSVLENIRVITHDFLVHTERELLFGNLPFSIFEKNMSYIERKLGEIAPEALKQFVAAYSLSSYTPESMAQAATSMRRLLVTIANVVYPPTDEKIQGADGKEHNLGKERYISRLWQFVDEQTESSTYKKLLGAQVNDVGHRIDYAYNFLNKAIHNEEPDREEIDPYEFNQVLIQTILVIGDILRLYENSLTKDDI